MACKDYHDHDSDIAFRMVIDYEGGSWKPNADGAFSQNAFVYHISLACNHCTQPACTHVCPTGAMHKDELGLVWPNATKCIGCGYCTMACPYHAPHIDAHLKRSSKCDGCRDRVAEGKSPICVEACPVRALEFDFMSDLARSHPNTVRAILPLPGKEATHPNLLILASPAAEQAEERGGAIANRSELGLEINL